MGKIKVLLIITLMCQMAYSQVPNTWSAKSNFGGTARYGAGSFSIGTKGYFTSGVDGSGYKQDTWQYDPSTDTWTQKADFGGGVRRYLACFSIGSKGYAGTGYDGASQNNDFYEYNPTLNIWIQKAFFPGVARSASSAFAIGNKGYLGLGTEGTNVYQDFYEYDPLADTWTAKTNFPGAAREQATGLGLDGKGYVGLGKAATMTVYNDFWQYDPISNTWLQKANFGGLARCGAVGFSIGQRAYVGTGSPDGAVTNYKDFWEYNPTTNIWLQKANVGTTGRDAAAGFAIGTKGYIGTGLINASTSTQTFFEYNPSLITYISGHTDVSCVGGSNGTASSISYGGTPPYTYSWAPSGGTSANAIGLAPGIYTITVTDASFSTATATVNIAAAGGPNSWVKKASFPTNNRMGGVGFSIGQKGYFGTGTTAASLISAYKKDFWEFDPATNVWTQKADFGGNPRVYAVGFAVGMKGYVGTGEDNTGNTTKDFWEYNPLTNVWMAKANFGGVKRVDAVGLSIGTKGYVGTGYDATVQMSDFWEYDPTINQWTQKANFGGGVRNNAVAFSIGGFGYISTGRSTGGNNSNDCWQYDPTTDVWIQKANFLGLARDGAVAFSVGTKGYLGTGHLDSGASTNDFYEYNSLTDTWTQRANYLGLACGYGSGFSIGTKGYIGAGYDNGILFSEFYEYTTLLSASLDTQTNVSCSGGSTGSATASPSGGNPPYSFSWNTTPAQTSATATNLVAGNYTCTVTDCDGSIATCTVAITQNGAPDSWSQRASFPAINRGSGVAFSIGNKGYFGTGENANGVTEYNDFWEYDPITNVWTQKANFGGVARKGATGFSIGSKGYLGIGHDNISGFKGDFWEYNPVTNSWIQKANFPPVKRYAAVGFSIGNKGYMGTGYENQSTGSFIWYNDFWEYDPSTDAWLQRTSVPGAGRSSSVGFSIGSKGYVGTGSTNNTAAGLVNDFYEFDPIANTWTQKANFAGGVRNYAIGFSIGGKGYIGTGSDGVVFKQDFWEYNPTTDTWAQKANFGGSARYNAKSFAIGTKGYIVKGYDGANQQDLWEYNPSPSVNIVSQTNVTCNGGANGTAVASASDGTAPYSFSWNTNPTQNSAIATGLSAGAYTVIVTDYCGGTGTASVTIIQPGTPDSWTLKASFGSYSIRVAMAFSIGTKGYIGTGIDSIGQFHQDFWEYDPTVNVWTQKANYGGGNRFGCASFSVGTKGYVGTGWNGTANVNDFWEYNPSSNTWTQKTSFPASARRFAVGLSIGTKGYIGLGYNGTTPYLNDFWEYNPSTDSWIQKTNFGGAARANAVGFSIASKAYVGTGSSSGGLYNDFWEYNQVNDTWTAKANVGQTLRSDAVGFAIDNRGFIGTGFTTGTIELQDFWEYNSLTDVWIQKANFPGTPRYSASALSIGNKGYIGCGYSNSLNSAYRDFYEYNPSPPTVTANFTNSNVGQTFTFTNTTVNGVSYLWNFGDGTISTLANPTHTYANGGTYNVCLTATNECVSNQICSSITFGCSNPTALFTSNVSGLTANFTNTSANATSYNWNFGDATSSTQQNPSHVYNASGTYTVTLTTINGCGTATVTHTVTVTCVAPTASYTFIVSGMTATFTNTSPNAANVTWNFSDPNSGANNSANITSPSHVFSVPGLYNVTLYVNNACGVDSVTQAVLVNCALPVSDFVSNPNGLNVQLNGLASTNAYTYSWSFGDGSPASIFPFDTHIYSTTGTYNVCLTTTNSCGTDTKCDSVTVCAVPIANFSSIANTTNVSFTNTSSQATNWFWNFGDGNASNLQNPTHLFVSSGTKTICLKASNSCGSDSVCNVLTLFCSSTMTPNICMATVDSLSINNIIYWEKSLYNNIDSFIVFREVSTNVYSRIGAVSNVLSLFIDTTRSIGPANGNPNITSYRYKLQLRDICGNYSAMSPYHNSVYFYTNSTGTYLWNSYDVEGQSTPITTFDLIRDNNATGIWTLVGSCAGGQTSLTDPAYTSYPNGIWRVEANGFNCNPTAKPLQLVNKSKSNVKNNFNISVGVSTINLNETISIAPNPVTTELIVSFNEPVNFKTTITITDVVGKVISSTELYEGGKSIIHVNELTTGIYFIKIQQKNHFIVKKFVKE